MYQKPTNPEGVKNSLSLSISEDRVTHVYTPDYGSVYYRQKMNENSLLLRCVCHYYEARIILWIPRSSIQRRNVAFWRQVKRINISHNVVKNPFSIVVLCVTCCAANILFRFSHRKISLLVVVCVGIEEALVSLTTCKGFWQRIRFIHWKISYV